VDVIGNKPSIRPETYISCSLWASKRMRKQQKNRHRQEEEEEEEEEEPTKPRMSDDAALFSLEKRNKVEASAGGKDDEDV